MYRIGFLFAGTIALGPQAREFWRKLQDLGYIEGKNFIAEVREAHGDASRLPKLASEIVDTHPDVIVAVTTPAVAAAKMATQTIPIVMAIAADPIGSGFVRSLARPEANITGPTTLQTEIIPKRVQLIKEMLRNRGKSGGTQAVAQRCLMIAGSCGTCAWFGTESREPR